MDEKELRGCDATMKKTFRNINKQHVMSLILSVLLLQSFFAVQALAIDLEPNVTMDTKVVPVMSGIKTSQVGDSVVLVTIRGMQIPHPKVVSSPGEAKLVLQWDGIRFAQNADKRDWWDSYEWSVLRLEMNPTETWWKDFTYPMLERVNAEPIGNRSVKLTFTSSKGLVLDEVKGVPGADELTLILKAYQTPKAVDSPKPIAPYAKGDPMGIRTPVTLQVRDGDVKSVFRMLADVQRLNLLLDPSVPDMPVTVSFKGVPFNEAFGYLLRMTDLTYALTGSTLVVGKPESIGKTLGKEVVRAYRLSYAVDDKGLVKNDLTGVLTGLVALSKPPTLDQRTRTLYVTATPDQHERVATILRKLDHPGQQIMLQAQIVEVNDDSKQELETLVSAVYDQWLINFTGGRLQAGYNYINGTLTGSGIAIPIAGMPYGTTGEIQNIHVDSGTKALTAGLNAMETNGKAKVLAKPSVIAIDAQEAKIQLTRNYKYVSGVDSNGNSTFSEVNAGPTLTFTPVIGRNGVITIKVSVETGEVLGWRPAGNGAQAPETTSRKVDTIVRVRNGEPFAVGGLYQELKNKNVSRIPVLGYIPLLGDLFTMRTDNHTKSEVAMIVVPYILDVPDDKIDTFDLQQSSLIK